MQSAKRKAQNNPSSSPATAGHYGAGNVRSKMTPQNAGYRSFAFFDLRFTFPQEGITLLLVVVIVSALLSISVGIFNVAYGQLRISGELADSFFASYAADQGMERLLYRDRRTQDDICDPGEVIHFGDPCMPEETVTIPAGGGATACYTFKVSQKEEDGFPGLDTVIQVSGQYRCGANADRVVRRGFQVIY